MRTLICFLAFGLLTLTQGMSQVKIGDNPQNINPSSVLELESSSHVLVITRIDTNEMNAITPLRGAMVYNTDEQCIFYFDGGQWVNLCADENTTNVSFELVGDELVLTDSDGNTVAVPLEGVGEQSFTSEPIVNFRETIVITQTGNTFNFEVGEITGENIADSTIQGVDFAPESITQDKIAPNSIGTSELQDNAVTDDDIDFFSADAVTLNDFTNDAGFITGAQLISPDANNAIIDSNGAFYNDAQLLADIDNNDQRISDHLAQDNDLDDQNERLTNAVLDGNELVLTEGGFDTRVDLTPLNNTGTDNQNLSFNGNRIEIERGNGVDLGLLLEADNITVNPTGNIGSDDVQEALEELQTDIDNLNAGGGNTDEQNLSTNNTPGNISIDNGNTITLNVNDGDFDDENELQDADEVNIDPITGITGDNVQLALEELQTDVNNLVAGGGADGNDFVTAGNVVGENLTLTVPNQANPIIDLSDFTLDTDLTIAIAAIEQVPDDTGSTNGNVLTTDGGGIYTWETVTGGANDFITGGNLNVESLELTGTGGAGATIDLSPFALDTDLTAFLTVEADGDPNNEIELPDDSAATNGDVLITDGLGNYSWAAITGGGVDTNNFIDNGNLNIESLELTGTGGAGATIDLSPFALDTDLTGFLTVEADGDPNNEIELPDDSAASAGDILSTDATGNYSWITPVVGANDFINTGVLNVESLELTGTGGAGATIDLSPFALDTDLTGFLTVEADGDPNNEIELPDDSAATAGDILSTDATGNYSWVTPTVNSNTNVAEIDLTLDGDRTHNLDGNNLVFDGTGNVGIGNLPGAPASKLDVDGQIQSRGGFASTEGTAGNPGYGFYTNGDTNMGMYRIAADQLGFSTDGVEAMRIDATQNVGIGVNPTEKLHVNGNLRIEGTITASGTINELIPDYVFQKYFNGFSNLDKTYQFYSLSKIERFIRKNKHLPGITSAAKAKKDGYWNLSQSNLQNLEKIEELFLHTIEQEKKIEKLNSENKELSEELNSLKSEIELIKSMLIKNQND